MSLRRRILTVWQSERHKERKKSSQVWGYDRLGLPRIRQSQRSPTYYNVIQLPTGATADGCIHRRYRRVPRGASSVPVPGIMRAIDPEAGLHADLVQSCAAWKVRLA